MQSFDIGLVLFLLSISHFSVTTNCDPRTPRNCPKSYGGSPWKLHPSLQSMMVLCDTASRQQPVMGRRRCRDWEQGVTATRKIPRDHMGQSLYSPFSLLQTTSYPCNKQDSMYMPFIFIFTLLSIGDFKIKYILTQIARLLEQKETFMLPIAASCSTYILAVCFGEL